MVKMALAALVLVGSACGTEDPDTGGRGADGGPAEEDTSVGDGGAEVDGQAVSWPEDVVFVEEGIVVSLTGEFDQTEPSWSRPSARCAGGDIDSYYRVHAIGNRTSDPIALTVANTIAQNGGVDAIHVFRGRFESSDLSTCVVGADTAPGGNFLRRWVSDLVIEPGQLLYVVASRDVSDTASGSYALTLRTPRCGDGIPDGLGGPSQCDPIVQSGDDGCSDSCEVEISVADLAASGQLSGFSSDDQSEYHLFVKPSAGCVHDDPTRLQEYAVYGIRNSSQEEMTVSVSLIYAYAPTGMTFIYRDSFDPRTVEGCQGGVVSKALYQDFVLGAGEIMYVVMTMPDGYNNLAPHSLLVEAL